MILSVFSPPTAPCYLCAMISLTTTFNTLYFSAELPDEVVFTTDNPYIEVRVYFYHAVIFSTTLYPYNGKATFHDLRSLVEAAIIKEGYSHGSFTLFAKYDSQSASTDDFDVVYSDIIQTFSAEIFCSSHFLTTRTSFRISRDGTQRLSLYAKAHETYDGYTECVVLPNGATSPVVLRLTDTVNRTSGWAAGVDYFEINAELIQDAVYDNFPQQAGKLLAFTVHRGARAMTFFVTDDRFNVSFSFRNAFDCVEYAELTAVTTAKQKMEQSEAVCQRNHIFYDRQTEQTFEVETAFLTHEEAIWLNQMLASRKVENTAAVGADKEVLIIESTSEISDSDDAKNRIKFTWKFAKDVQRQRVGFKSINFTTELA